MPAAEPLLLRFAPFELDERQARLTRAGQPVALAPKAFEVLCALARQPAQLVRKDELLDTVWGHRHVSESVLKTIVSELRAALGDDARQPRFIETASRRGYRFIAALQGAVPAAAGASAPEPAPASGPSLIGRAAARGQLHAAWHAAASGRRQVMWLTGEAGIGKTTLIDHFIAELGNQAIVAHGQCVEQRGAGEPYLPVLQALGALCRDDASFVQLLRSVAPTWLLQLPWLISDGEREALRRELTGIGQERMLREFGEWLDRAARERTLVLVTEDLHWSDSATLRLLDHVARRRGPARLLWLASFRLAEVIAEDHPMKALRHELRLHRLAAEIALDPFSESEVGAYLEQHFDATVREPLVRALHARTDGLPLFVARVVDDWSAQGVRANDAVATAALPGAPVPESLAGVIDMQIERLPSRDRELLEAASVCGVEFGSATLADVIGADAGDVGVRCDELARRQQWLSARAIDAQRDGTLGARFVFRHALYRQVLYQRIGTLARAQLHRKVASSMGRCRGSGIEVSAAELAMHHELSQDIPAALRAYAEAAESALSHFAPAEALALTERALALLASCPGGAEKLELELGLLGPRTVAASHVVGVTAPITLAAYERVETLCDLVPSRSRALEAGTGWAHYVRGDYARAWARAEHLHAMALQRNDRMLRVAACNLSGAVSAYRGQLALARDWVQRGIDEAAGVSEHLATSLTVVDLEVSLRSRFSQVLAHLGAIEEARAQIDAANARARTLTPYALRLVQIFEGFFEVRLEHAERVQTLAESIRRLADEHGIAQAGGTSRWLRGVALARLGQPLEGHALIVEGFGIDERLGVMRGRSGVLGYAVDALVRAARWDDAQAQLNEALALAERLGERLHLPDLLLLQGRIALGRGDGLAARGAMRAALAEAQAQGALWLELTAAVALCELAGATRDDFAALAARRAALTQGLGEALVARADALLAPGAR